ncbi:hypothetical protein ASPCAL11371 [Aspergillus calidoustus]|uniref:Uncharacterized protein n=1 Tax=Aspergillus calidoustus TaxID=454130 RepID=A0A0U5CEC6_ASPCI|nr:hypothetical protein ASPCAL11371 [Aspergillus calidoustus]
MRDLADFPAELLHPILGLAFAGRPPPSRFDHDPDGVLDLRGLSRLLLVNHRWHETFLPYVYSSWSFDGGYQPYRCLWKFFRTIMTHPHLAALVQTLNIGNWGFGLPYYIAEQPLNLDAEELGLVSKAVHLAGLQHLEVEILSKVSTPLARNHPLVALLLARLPNVSTIYAHIPDSDPYLHSVLLAALERPCTIFTNLKTIYLLPEVPVLEPYAPEFKSDSAYYPALSLDMTWPALYLPTLRALYLYNLETKGLADLLASHAPKHARECLITCLSIATHKDSKCLPEDISALLALPKALTSVSLFWNNYKFKTGPSKKDVVYKVSNNQIYHVLQKHSSSLENIDIFHGLSTGHHNIKDHFGPLTMFVVMKSLTVQAEVLLGCDDSKILTCLPAGLRTLTLMVDTVRQARLPGLLSQLGLLVESDKPTLKRLRLCENNPKYTDPDTLEAYQNLLGVCAQHNVSFGIVGYWSPGDTDCLIASGGRCPWIWRKTMHMMGTGIHRREKVRTRLVRREFGESSSSGGEDETNFTYGVHTVPFRDHRGRASFMVFEARDPPKLPPLISCSFYFTHPDTEPGSLDLEGLFRAIENQKDDFHVRLDIYFLPGASETDCIAHYRAERATRADSRVQMQESRQRRGVESIPPLLRPLPGMIQRLRGRERFEGALCICADPDWNSNSGNNNNNNGNPEQTFSCVQFRARDEVEETGLPPRFTEVFPLAGNTESAVSGWVWNLAHGFLDEFLGPYQRAERKGWGYW